MKQLIEKKEVNSKEKEKEELVVTPESLVGKLLDLSEVSEDLMIWSYAINFPLGIEEEEKPNDFRVIQNEKVPVYSAEIHHTKVDFIDHLELKIRRENTDVSYSVSLDSKKMFVVVENLKYEYPPTNLLSVIFFCLNPDIEKKVLELSENLQREYTTSVEEWFMIRNTIRSVRRKHLSSPPETDDDDVITSFSFGIYDHPEIKVFNYFERGAYEFTADYYFGFDTIYFYELGFKEGKVTHSVLVRETKPDTVVFLLSRMLPKDEISPLHGEVVKVLERLKEALTAVITIDKFKKQYR